MGNVQSSLPSYYNADPTNEAYKHSLSDYVDLASAAIGARVIRASNERFGAASNLIKPQEPGTADSGKVDAWVTRRHNPETDWAVVRLGSAGTIAGFDIDTRGLDGEQASHVSIQGCLTSDKAAVDSHGNIDDAEWEELLPEVEISANSHHLLALWRATKTPYNFVRITLHPDGGVSRLRILGTVTADLDTDGELDLALVTAGARVVQVSDEKLGAKENLILPGRATSAVRETQGWKTRRSQSDEHSDWAIVRLAEPGFLTRIELDTLFYDGDQPVSAAVQACYTELDSPDRDRECFWYQIVPRTELNGNKLHKIDVTLNDVPFSHIKLLIYPDGGIGRLRAFGQRVKEIEEEAAREKAEAAAEAALVAELAADADSFEQTEILVTETKVKTSTAEKKDARSKTSAAAAAARVETSGDEKDDGSQRKKTKKTEKPASRKKSKSSKTSHDTKEAVEDEDSDKFSSRAGELIQSLTSPLPPRKRGRPRSRAEDETDDGSINTMDSRAKRSHRKTKSRTTAAAQRYVEMRNLVSPVFRNFYENYQTIESSAHQIHKGHGGFKLCRYLLHRKLRLFHAPIRGVSLRDMLRAHVFKVYHIDEYRTSVTCPVCYHRLEKFRWVDNPHPWQRRNHPRVLCYGLLHFTSEKYSKDVLVPIEQSAENHKANIDSVVNPMHTLKTKARAKAKAKARVKKMLRDSPAKNMPNRIWNRDLAAVINMWAILHSLRDDNGIPRAFQHGNNNALAAPQSRCPRTSTSSVSAITNSGSTSTPAASQARHTRKSAWSMPETAGTSATSASVIVGPSNLQVEYLASDSDDPLIKRRRLDKGKEPEC
ncbi:galactose-binding like protein [Coemansia reversa NRRL 1564]|uniref:Galactose-binding like protein n=1 Tax=Coemansia reversa (strain ATCC 12441 / NRRL 1564) TaxID=763665 RepID=A0A2G5BKU7_COERN|nr:galactose-binding like protein [Coemansia reversa NRRL 1564]|eukprot:PIA19644.1 galactose-binding like protein [Coemansia reversa NRRL 1564]